MNDVNNIITSYFSDFVQTLSMVDQTALAVAIEAILNAKRSGNRIFTCGNGGSASTASHYITDWNKMTPESGNGKFFGMCLSDNIGLITAYANDIEYGSIFSRQIQNLGNAGDVLVLVSGSGNSANVIGAAVAANELGLSTIAVVGFDGGQLKKVSTNSVHFPSFDMQLCEDFHLMFGHLVMKALTNSVN